MYLVSDTAFGINLQIKITACPEDLWGSECSMPCECSNRGLCSPADGSCDCDPGWIGASCNQGNLRLETMLVFMTIHVYISYFHSMHGESLWQVMQ